MSIQRNFNQIVTSIGLLSSIGQISKKQANLEQKEKTKTLLDQEKVKQAKLQTKQQRIATKLANAKLSAIDLANQKAQLAIDLKREQMTKVRLPKGAENAS